MFLNIVIDFVLLIHRNCIELSRVVSSFRITLLSPHPDGTGHDPEINDTGEAHFA